MGPKRMQELRQVGNDLDKLINFGWDMKSRPPKRLDDAAAHLFRLAPDGAPAVERLDIPLDHEN